MKAAQMSEYGDASVVKVAEVSKPAAGDGQVLVEVHASSLNPFDTSVRAGRLKDMIPLKLPVTLGGDIAGVVAEVGAGVAGFAAGERVWGQANVVAGNSGALAEFAATSAEQVGKMPAGLDFEQAASLPLVGVSAWQALTENIKLASGQKLFIHGGAGGIGSIAIQIAKHIGAAVTTTATGDDIAYVKALGADAAVDYKREDFGTLRDFDAVFDTVGGDDFNKLLAIVRRGGVAVSMIAHADSATAAGLGVTAISQGTKVTTAALDALAELVVAGAVKPQVTKTFALDEIVPAFEARESSRVRGKIVIKIR